MASYNPWDFGPLVEEPEPALRRPGVSPIAADMGDVLTGAAHENPWVGPTPRRAEGLGAFAAKPYEERRSIFDSSLDEALDVEGIADPSARDYWKQSMTDVVTGGSGRFPGENPELNPFIMAGESGGQPGDPDALNSSALGYYQWILHDPYDPNKDPYGHRAYIPPGYEDMMFDPVVQHRMFIRAINQSGKHKGDPGSVVREKASTKVWGP